MAAVTTPEHVEQHSAPLAEKAVRVPAQKIEIDGNLLAMLGVGVALFALAFGAFTHLSGRIDSVATELRTDIKDVNTKIDRVAADLNAKIDRVDAKIDKVSGELNARLDRLDAKMDARFDAMMAELRELRRDRERGARD